MAVRAVVRSCQRAAEAARLHAVRQLGLQRVVRTVARMQIGFHAVFGHLAGDDVDDAAHRVRAVEHRRRPPDHLDPFGQHRLIGVGDRMPHQPHVLRVAVDEHQQAGRRTSGLAAVADAAQGHLPGGPRRHAVAHHAASGGEQPRNPRCERGQQRRLAVGLDPPAADDRDGHRQMPDVRLGPRAGDDHFADRVGRLPAQAVGRTRPERTQRCRSAQQKQGDLFFHNGQE